MTAIWAEFVSLFYFDTTVGTVVQGFYFAFNYTICDVLCISIITEEKSRRWNKKADY